MVDAPALTRLVGDAASFLATSWGREPVHFPADPLRGVPDDLLGLDDVDHLVAASGLRAPAFRLVKGGVTLPQASVTRRVRIGSRPVSDLVDVGAVHRAVADGATLVLQGLHRSFAPVAAFCRDLEATLTHPVQANAYLTPPVAQGLNLHEDPHDVFAVQTYGHKRWIVEPPGTDGADRAWDLQLASGDVLYLPAGTRHAAQTIDAASLHLTLGVRTVTWRDVVARAVDELLRDSSELDVPLPAGWAAAPQTLAPDLADRLADVVAALTSVGPAAQPGSGTVLDRQAASFWTSRTPDLGGGLRDLLEVDHLDDDTRLRRRDGVSLEVRETDERAEVVLRDRILRLPLPVAAALRQLATVASLRPSDLESFLDPASRLALCRRFVREGILTVDRSDVGNDPSGRSRPRAGGSGD